MPLFLNSPSLDEGWSRLVPGMPTGTCDIVSRSFLPYLGFLGGSGISQASKDDLPGGEEGEVGFSRQEGPP